MCNSFLFFFHVYNENVYTYIRKLFFCLCLQLSKFMLSLLFRNVLFDCCICTLVMLLYLLFINCFCFEAHVSCFVKCRSEMWYILRKNIKFGRCVRFLLLEFCECEFCLQFLKVAAVSPLFVNNHNILWVFFFCLFICAYVCT